MTRLPSRNARVRFGVTLVELLIVILVMLMITAVTVPVIRPALEGRKIREAARMVEVFLNGARNRALKDGRPVGIWIQPDEDEVSSCTKLAYCSIPDPYAGDFLDSTLVILGNGGFGAWQSQPSIDKMGQFVPGVVATADAPFLTGDVGWIENIGPGDLFYLNNDDTTQYRLYAGEPFIDANADGVYQPGELFNDVDGSTDYTPPDFSIIDQATGMFTQFPPIVWGTQSARVTYTFADELVATDYMSTTGNYYYQSGTDPMTGNPIFTYTKFPLFLSLSAYNPTVPPYQFLGCSTDSLNNGNPSLSLPFNFIRRPVRLNGAVIDLPAGTCIDLGSNYVNGTDIIGIPGSGFDLFVPFSGGSSTLGYFASFRPNPVSDHAIVGDSTAQGKIHFPIAIMFNESGVVNAVYSYDERSFIKSTSLSSSPLNPTQYRGRYPLTNLYFLIGKSDFIDGNPETRDAIANGIPPAGPIFNLQDPESIWVSIIPQTGLISTTENVAPDLTSPVPTSSTQMQLYFNAQAYQARSLAREALDMGGR